MALTDNQLTDLERASAQADQASTALHPDINYPAYIAAEIAPLIERWLSPAPCDMTHTEPFDFAQCETHATTFPLGSTCKFEGREPWEVFAEEADNQRQRAVKAEHRLALTEAHNAGENP